MRCWRRWRWSRWLITAYGFLRGARGAWARGLAFAILLFALAGPMLVQENHAPLPDVVVMVTDRSQSMGMGDRAAQAESALAAGARSRWPASPT